MTKWEYLVLERSVMSEKELDELGLEGWELVAFVRNREGDLVSYFKRPLEK